MTSFSLPEILKAGLTDGEKAEACIERFGLRESDDCDLRAAAITFALLQVAYEVSQVDPK